MTRAFVAVRLSDVVLDSLDDVVAPARRSLVGPRWSTREQWHVTLQFLGDISDVDAAGAALGAVSGAPALRATLAGAGAFPSARRARVVWVGATDSESGSAWSHLAAAVERALSPLGLVGDARPFRPHVTVARLRRPAPVHPAVDALGAGLEAADPAALSWTAGEVVLFASALGRGGARYTPLAEVPLAPAGDIEGA